MQYIVSCCEKGLLTHGFQTDKLVKDPKVEGDELRRTSSREKPFNENTLQLDGSERNGAI